MVVVFDCAHHSGGLLPDLEHLEVDEDGEDVRDEPIKSQVYCKWPCILQAVRRLQPAQLLQLAECKVHNGPHQSRHHEQYSPHRLLALSVPGQFQVPHGPPVEEAE